MAKNTLDANYKKGKPKVRYTKSAIKSRTKKGGATLLSTALIKKGSSNAVAKSNIVRGDTVVVISGDDKGKTGKVIKVLRSQGKVIVEGVNIIKKHKKAMGPGRPGEIVETEAPIFASKVMQWDESKKKATRVGHKVLENGTKVRISKVSGEQLD